MKVYQEILDRSREIDDKYLQSSLEEIDNFAIRFEVPKKHKRYKFIQRYDYTPLMLGEIVNSRYYSKKSKNLFLVDNGLLKIDFVKRFLKDEEDILFIDPLEHKSKVIGYLDKLAKEKKIDIMKDLTIFVLGGGLTINIGAYFAEKFESNLVLFPSTVLSMCDSSGGKVRVNFISNEKHHKHYYKSFYEPNAMFFDERFLYYLPKKEKLIGLVEVIKHSLFQSSDLYDYLMDNSKELIENKEKLKKAVIWTADLKRICLEVDVDETTEGSKLILRAGHDISDKVEEKLKFKIPHGLAVAVGIVEELKIKKDENLLSKAKSVFEAYGIPYSLKDYEDFCS